MLRLYNRPENLRAGTTILIWSELGWGDSRFLNTNNAAKEKFLCHINSFAKDEGVSDFALMIG